MGLWEIDLATGKSGKALELTTQRDLHMKRLIAY
jgi:hypothetical protein